jgi:hypothetical protein
MIGPENRKRLLPFAFVLLTAVGCGPDGGSKAVPHKDAQDGPTTEVNQSDTAGDVAAETAGDVAAETAGDVAAETGPDVTPDAGSDAGGSDVGKDAGAGSDVGKDVGAGSDVGKDVAAEAPAPDAPGDTGPAEAAVEAGPPDAAPETVAMCGRIKCDCTLKGIPLFGKVKILTTPGGFPTFKIRETAFPDLKVLKTDFPTSCGKWQEVQNFEDFSVEVVTAFEDFQIQYSAFPGIP